MRYELPCSVSPSNPSSCGMWAMECVMSTATAPTTPLAGGDFNASATLVVDYQ